MDKFTFIGLWDVYGGLLTEVQKEITDMYFNLDLTVSEIAKEKGISRQAVSDCLKGCKKQLEEFEEKLGFCKKLSGISLQFSFMMTDAGKWAEGFKAAHSELTTEISALENILNRNYSNEVSAVEEDVELQKLLNKDYTLKVYKSPKTGEENG